jgi:hypothetical protein
MRRDAAFRVMHANKHPDARVRLNARCFALSGLSLLRCLGSQTRNGAQWRMSLAQRAFEASGRAASTSFAQGPPESGLVKATDVVKRSEHRSSSSTSEPSVC